MPEYLFQLGREPLLSLAELQSVFLSLGLPWLATIKKSDQCLIKTAAPLPLATLQDRLGGTIKIAERLTKKEPPEDSICRHLESAQPTGKIVFSITGANDRALAMRVKKQLAAGGRNVRYIQANNSATIIHNNLLKKQGDLELTPEGIFVTRTIQDIESFSTRDFGRPGRDPHRGLIPPKLAKILINLGELPLTATLLDPFCGAGTILMEARLLGYQHVIGSDISAEAIRDTRANLAWLREQNLLPREAANATEQLLTVDVRRLGDKLAVQSIDGIISEPFLGDPRRQHATDAKKQQEIRQLQTLYLDAFRTFHTLLKPQGIVVCILPAFRLGKNEWLPLAITDEIKKIGFAIRPLLPDHDFIRYSRHDQLVARDIYRFEKNIILSPLVGGT